MAKKQRPFLAAGGAGVPLPARKCHEKLFFAIGKANYRESLFNIATIQKLIDGGADYRSPEAVLLLILLTGNGKGLRGNY